MFTQVILLESNFVNVKKNWYPPALLFIGLSFDSSYPGSCRPGQDGRGKSSVRSIKNTGEVQRNVKEDPSQGRASTCRSFQLVSRGMSQTSVTSSRIWCHRTHFVTRTTTSVHVSSDGSCFGWPSWRSTFKATSFRPHNFLCTEESNQHRRVE